MPRKAVYFQIYLCKYSYSIVFCSVYLFASLLLLFQYVVLMILVALLAIAAAIIGMVLRNTVSLWKFSDKEIFGERW